VRDVDDRHPQLGLDSLQLLEDLVLHDDVEGGGRLVGDDQLRAARQSHGDDRALAHATRELVRVPIKHVRREPDRVEQLLHVLALLLVAHDAAVVGVERLADLVADAVYRVPRVHRALEDHRDLLPAPPPHLIRAQPQQILAVEPNLARHVHRVRREQPQQRQRDRGLAAARLADQAHRLTLVNRERDVVDGRHFAGLDLVVHDKPIDLQQWSCGVDLACLQVLQGDRHRSLRVLTGPEVGD
jgi:hypothetical protein